MKFKKASKFLVFIFLFAALFNLFPEELSVEQIFESYSSSVVYISHSIYFDSKLVKNQDLFDKIEKNFDKKFLNTFIPLTSGSGFIITNNGYIVTNSHIFDLETEEDLKKDSARNSFYNNLVTYFNKLIPLSLMNDAEFKRLKEDLYSLAYKSEVKYHVKVDNSKDYTAKLIKSDKKADMAILKIDTNEKIFNAIPIGNSDLLKVGQKVIAIGYPLPDKFGFLKDFKPTLTEGTVSALRTDDYGIQHTASINPGNSGGPLINISGEVVGINTAYLRDANNIFFSIPTKKVKEWLSSNDQGNLILQNKENASIITAKRFTREGLLIVSSSLKISKGSNFKIYINGKFVANSPRTVKLGEGISVIRLESESDYSEEKVFADYSIRDAYLYSPTTKTLTGRLIVESTPSQAEVYINDSLVGKTPYTDNQINSGEIKIKVRMKDFLEKEDKITIPKNNVLRYSVNLEKAYKIIFKNEVPDDAEITLTNAQKEKITYKKNDSYQIKNGKWKLNIKGKSFKNFDKDIEVKGKDLEIVDNFERIKTIVTLKDLKPNSKVFISGKDYTDKVKDSNLELSIGDYDLEVKLEKYQTFRKRLLIEKEGNVVINVVYRDSIEKSEYYGTSGTICIVIGSLFTTYGLFAVPMSSYFYNTYKDYQASFYDQLYWDDSNARWTAKKNLAQGFLISGAIILGLGFTMQMISIPLIVVYRKNIYEVGIIFNKNGSDVGFQFAMKF